MEQFHAYEIRVATRASDVDSDRAMVFTKQTNPELGRLSLDDTQGQTPVLQAVVSGLEPDTEYFARLELLDTAGGRVRSPNLAVDATKPRPDESRTVFDEDPLDARMWPSCWEWSSERPDEGLHHLALTVVCAGPSLLGCGAGTEPTCFDFLRFEGIGLDLGAGVGGGAFADAYLEFSLAIDSTEVSARTAGHAWWTQIRLRSADGLLHSHHPGPVFVADGAYHRYQIPLEEFGLDHVTLGELLLDLHIGSRWTQGTRVRLDGVRVNW